MLHIEHEFDVARNISLRNSVMAKITGRARWRSRNAIVRTQFLVIRRFVTPQAVIFRHSIVAISQESSIIVLKLALWILALENNIVTRHTNDFIVLQRALKTLVDIHVAYRNT
jgi:hypothetical protein